MPDPSPHPRLPDMVPPPALRDDRRSDRSETLRAEVAERLRPVCGAMPPDQFDALVRDIVAFKLRWAPE